MHHLLKRTLERYILQFIIVHFAGVIGLLVADFDSLPAAALGCSICKELCLDATIKGAKVKRGSIYSLADGKNAMIL